MGVESTTPSSRRGYLSQDELEQFANITILDTDEADDVISQAEEMIDTYVGFQKKFFRYALSGLASGGTTTTLTLDTDHKNSYNYVDYFKGLTVEIIGGTNEGERRRCTGSSVAGVLTTNAFPSANDTTTFYKIYQIGKFPRKDDVVSHNQSSTITYYKQIPEAVKRATAAQVEYIVNMGNKFFSTDASRKQSESIGDYSYTKGSKGGKNEMIAPKARNLLKGITSRVGTFV